MSCVSIRRKTFQPYCEPFRPLNDEEKRSVVRVSFVEVKIAALWREFQVSYQSHLGGFTICNILLNNKLYSGSSCCSKADRWLPIRGKMLAFRRAMESEGVAV